VAVAEQKPRRKTRAKLRTVRRDASATLTVGTRGPLPKIVTEAEMRLLGSQLCTLDEAASALRISRTTFFQRLKENPRLREAYDEGRDNTHSMLRMRQIQIALSPTHPQAAMMLVHLGKSLLNQSEKQQHEHFGPGGGPIEVREIRRLIVAADPARFADGPVIEHAGAESGSDPEAIESPDPDDE
jgi:hypothetical protein